MPLLIYANKSDLNAEGNKIENFIEGIKDCLKDKPYFIQESSQRILKVVKKGWIGLIIIYIFNKFIN